MNSVLGLTISAAGIAALAAAAPTSGLAVGDTVGPFRPSHVVGPFANTDKCFVSAYNNKPQIQVWVNSDSMDNVAKIAKELEATVEANKSKEFKAMIVMLMTKSTWEAMKPKISKMASDNKIDDVAISMLDPKEPAVKAYKINTSKEVKNTVYLYKDWKITGTIVNFEVDATGLKLLKGQLSRIL